MRKSIKIGKHTIPLWLIGTLLLSGIALGLVGDYVWRTLNIPLEVKEPLEIISYPSQLSLFPGETQELNITITNHASQNYYLVLDLSLDNATYQNSYVTFSNEIYTVVPATQNITAWLKVRVDAPPTNTALIVNLVRTLPFHRASSGKIAYDTFSASGGTATDIPWTILEGLHQLGYWTVEEGKFRSEAYVGDYTAIAYPTDVYVKDFVWEAKVKPMLLATEGPEITVGDLPIDSCQLEVIFDYYHAGGMLRLMIAPGPYGTPHSTYQTTHFVMNKDQWYTMKVAVFGSNMKAYVDNMLKFDITDPNLAAVSDKALRHSGYYNGEWGYWDDVKIWKSNFITVINLEEQQKIELYDHANNLRSSDIVGAGETKAVLDVSALAFPFGGYFKIYSSDGVTVLRVSAAYEDIWGGDTYSVTEG